VIFDYLIIGQGLCGSWLSHYLLESGASVLVMDPGTQHSASGAASGLINPVTGKRLARQWMGDTIQPFARMAYEDYQERTGRRFARPIAIHNFFSTAEEAAFFEQKSQTTHEALLQYHTSIAEGGHFNYHYGVGSIPDAFLIDVAVFLEAHRDVLKARNAIQEERFDWTQCELQDEGIRYKGIAAKAVIDCSGYAAVTNPYFERLPFALNKGEYLIASIPGLSPTAIFKQGTLSIAPWPGGGFWIGSTFDWDFKDELPTREFRERSETHLHQWLRLPFKIQEHHAAIRPATVTRDAFVGMHPLHSQVGILNGMGSKGCSLAPYLGKNLADHLLAGVPLVAQMDVGRYQRALGN